MVVAEPTVDVVEPAGGRVSTGTEVEVVEGLEVVVVLLMRGSEVLVVVTPGILISGSVIVVSGGRSVVDVSGGRISSGIETSGIVGIGNPRIGRTVSGPRMAPSAGRVPRVRSRHVKAGPPTRHL